MTTSSVASNTDIILTPRLDINEDEITDDHVELMLKYINPYTAERLILERNHARKNNRILTDKPRLLQEILNIINLFAFRKTFTTRQIKDIIANIPVPICLDHQNYHKPPILQNSTIIEDTDGIEVIDPNNIPHQSYYLDRRHKQDVIDVIGQAYNHIIIPDDHFASMQYVRLYDMEGDGSCYYRALSHVIFGYQEHYKYFRVLLQNHLLFISQEKLYKLFNITTQTGMSFNDILDIEIQENFKDEYEESLSQFPDRPFLAMIFTYIESLSNDINYASSITFYLIDVFFGVHTRIWKSCKRVLPSIIEEELSQSGILNISTDDVNNIGKRIIIINMIDQYVMILLIIQKDNRHIFKYVNHLD
jgi:hypothetical protein